MKIGANFLNISIFLYILRLVDFILTNLAWLGHSITNGGNHCDTSVLVVLLAVQTMCIDKTGISKFFQLCDPFLVGCFSPKAPQWNYDKEDVHSVGSQSVGTHRDTRYVGIQVPGMICTRTLHTMHTSIPTAFDLITSFINVIASLLVCTQWLAASLHDRSLRLYLARLPVASHFSVMYILKDNSWYTLHRLPVFLLQFMSSSWRWSSNLHNHNYLVSNRLCECPEHILLYFPIIFIVYTGIQSYCLSHASDLKSFPEFSSRHEIEPI